MSSVIVISDDEQDELNISRRPNLSSPIPPGRFLGNPGSSESPGEPKAKVHLKIEPPGQKKRRRVSDAEYVEVQEVSRVKKAKREQRKAVSASPRVIISVAAECADGISPLVSSALNVKPQLTIVINSQKVQAVAAQHRWIHHHKHLFIPLVGPKSHFFSNLDKEMEGLAPAKKAIFEFEEIEKQPKLIKGGQMKDYQVKLPFEACCCAARADHGSSSTDCPFLLGCIRMVRPFPPRRTFPRFNSV